jgi:hypothetical protein
MGKVKLTLTVEDQVIFKAKHLAMTKKQSLSNIIEQFLLKDFLGKENDQAISIAKSLRGIGKSELSSKSDKEIKEMMVRDKYGI